MSRRDRGRDVTGVLNLDKPAGMTSAAAVAAVKRLFDARRVGHAGTLDPLAHGVLPICLGNATRLVEFAHRWPKRYHAVLALGATSATYDSEGPIEPGEDPSGVTADRVEAVLGGFRGRIRQKPPAYSALKTGGERMYRLARRGEEVDPPERDAEVHELRLVALVTGPAATLELDILCATGTYVRSLAHDIGRELSCGAYLASLSRTTYGPLELGSALTPDAVEALPAADRESTLLPPDALVRDLPMVALGVEQRLRMLNGNPVAIEDRLLPGASVRAYWEGRLVAIGRMSHTRMLEPVKVFPEAVN